MWNQMKSNWILVIILLAIAIVALSEILQYLQQDGRQTGKATHTDSSWIAPSLYSDHELQGAERELVIYGEALVAHTSEYLGPKGSVQAISNGMNCQNCHLGAGKKNWGNNYSAVYATYPKFRDRSGTMESIYKRVSDCFERSLNGSAPDSNSREYKAIYAYIKWLGKDVPKGQKPHGSGIGKLPYLDRAADPEKGKAVYATQCQSCHGANGQGQPNLEGNGYEYPPLWGEHSYNDGAGLFRLSNLAGYIKSNMPFKLSTHENPLLSNEEAWDLAAFINSQPRPHREQGQDWPDISKKPVDHPFGPYTDGFSETQHKYGPYAPIQSKRSELAKKI